MYPPGFDKNWVPPPMGIVEVIRYPGLEVEGDDSWKTWPMLVSDEL